MSRTRAVTVVTPGGHVELLVGAVRSAAKQVESLVDVESIPRAERARRARELEAALRPLRRLARDLRAPEREARLCARPGCSKPVTAKRSDARYCSTACRVAAHRAAGRPAGRG